MTKKNLFTVFLTTVAVSVWGQFLPEVSLQVNDQSNNNPAYWNDVSWTDSLTASHDLADAAAPLSAIFSHNGCPTPHHFHYELKMDLNGDGILETLVHSDSTYSPGSLFFNNVASGALAVSAVFDQRAVSSDQKWIFGIVSEPLSNNQSRLRAVWTTTIGDTIAVPQLPYGNHQMVWWAESPCDTFSLVATTQIRDKGHPSISAQSPLSPWPHDNGWITIHAEDLIQSVSDNYTPADRIEVAIRPVGAGIGFPLTADGQPQTTIYQRCSPTFAAEYLAFVEVWARDLAGNTHQLEQSFYVQDLSDDACNFSWYYPGTFWGLFTTPDHIPIENVEVKLIPHSLNGIPLALLQESTDAQGACQFNLDAIPLNPQAEFVIPVKNDDALNGVSIWDLVLISRHILNIEPLSSPYNIVAADANKSGTVTSFDITELRKLILGTYTSLPQNNSWRFIKALPFNNPDNPFTTPMPDSIYVIGYTGIPCYGIKVGDVNNSATLQARGYADDRTRPTLFLTVEDQDVSPGAVFDVRMQVENGAAACQLHLQGNGLSYLEVLPVPGLNEEYYAISPDQSRLAIAAETPLQWIELRCKAHRKGKISEMMEISEREVPAKAYAENGAELRPVLWFEHPASAGVYPNPFRDDVSLLFEQKNAGKVDLIISDALGRICLKQDYWLNAGKHEIFLSDLPDNAQGQLFYRLTVDGSTLTGGLMRLR